MKYTEPYPHLSNRVSKLGECIPTINLPAGTTCRCDAPCQKGCYATKGNFKYTTVANGLAENLRAYIDNPTAYFNKILYTLKAIPYKHFRYHSSGDIVNAEYLEQMVRVAKEVPETRFLCFTKKYEIVNEYLNKNELPENLIIVFSCWGEFGTDKNPHNPPTSHVRFKKGDNSHIPTDANECDGFCGKCVNTNASCWKLKHGESVVFNQH